MTKQDYVNAILFLEELVSCTESNLAYREDALKIIDAMIDNFENLK